MRNKILVAALGVCVAALAVCVDYIYTESLYSDRVEEHEVYEELKVDPHTLYNGYTVEELGSGYDKPSRLFNKSVIDVPVINQYPELPVGCEAVCGAALLQYLGFETDKISFTDGYIEWDENFYYDEDDELHGPDPRKVFAGDPYEWGYGCTAEVLAGAMNSFFAEKNPSYTALAIDEEINSADIEKLIDEGVPIIVWATIDMKPFNYRKPSEWIINGTDDEVYCWYGNSHTLVLCGYDSTCYYFMDPNDKEEIVPYMKSTFLTRFEENGFQAVVVKIEE